MVTCGYRSKLKTEDLIYLAGLLDSYGSICKINGNIRFTITNKNYKLLRWIQQVFGGSLYSCERSRRDKWSLKLSGKQAKKLLSSIHPWTYFRRIEIYRILEKNT